jgi:hypothetical protein
MSLAADMPRLIAAHQQSQQVLSHNAELIDIHEGNLLAYVEQALENQLKAQAMSQARHRIAPINLLNKIVDKLSPIYSPGPARRVNGGTDADQELLDWYVREMKADAYMGDFVRALALCKSAVIYPFAHRMKPSLRITRNDRFFVASSDHVDPMRPTEYVTFCGNGEGGVTYTAWSETGILIFNEKMEIDTAAMAAFGNDAGVNPFGVLPVVYRSVSRQYLMPKPDSDVLRMTKLIPVMLSDLNYAAMFQCFSILYGIDIDDKNIEFAPNAFMRFTSNPETEKKPQLGQIKPQVDIDQVLGLVQSQLALWLNSRGIRPGAVGKLDKDNFASGISKMIDEMDTVELRQKLVDIMVDVEAEFWQVLMHKLHPVWVRAQLLPTQQLFTPQAEVAVTFAPQGPNANRGQQVTDLKAERDAGFTTRRRALKQLNPLMSDQELDELEAEIEADKAPAPPPFDLSFTKDEEETDEEEGAP